MQLSEPNPINRKIICLLYRDVFSSRVRVARRAARGVPTVCVTTNRAIAGGAILITI